MKKLFYLLFISSVLASCAKPDPIEVNVNVTQDSTFCNCGGATNGTGTSSSSFNCDTSLVGLWIGTRTLSNSGWEFFINESGYGYYGYNGENSGHYDCTDGFLSFIDENEDGGCLSGNYSISGNTMIFEIIAGYLQGHTFTLTKQ